MAWYWIVAIVLGSVATGVFGAFAWFAWYMKDAFG